MEHHNSAGEPVYFAWEDHSKCSAWKRLLNVFDLYLEKYGEYPQRGLISAEDFAVIRQSVTQVNGLYQGVELHGRPYVDPGVFYLEIPQEARNPHQ